MGASSTAVVVSAMIESLKNGGVEALAGMEGRLDCFGSGVKRDD